MHYTVLRVAAVLSLLLLGSVWLFGQAETGVITGTVTDPSNAVIADAKVTLVSTTTGLVRTTTTASAGEYTITNLKPDIYNLTIEHTAFQKYSRQVQVLVASRNEVSAQLALTGGSTTVEVTASGAVAVVNTESQTLDQVVTSKQVLELPTLTRNPYDLVAIAGNVSDDANSARGTGYAINGQRSASTDILLDGGENVDLYTATVGQPVPLDSVQEFNVMTSNYSAEYGRASGGVVNVATKSGTNDFHGSLYEFNRVSALAANTSQNNADRYVAFHGNPFTGDGPTCVQGQPCNVGKFGFTRNQFGYSVGGPIAKNKLFFFSATEWTRIRSNTTQLADIIDPAFLSLPQVNTNTVGYFNQFGKLRSDVSVLSKVNWGQATRGVCPAPLSCSDPLGMVAQWNYPADSGGGTPQNTYSTVNRVDWNISDKTTLYGRYALFSEYDLPGSWTTSPYIGFSTTNTNFNQSVNINLTHIFTPNLVSSTKFTYNRFNNQQPMGENPASPTLYTTPSGVPALPGTSGSLIFPGYNAFTPGAAIPFGGPQNLYQIYEDISWIKGKHQFKFGGAYIHTRDNRLFGAYENPIEPLGSSFAGNSNYTNYTSALFNLVNGNIYRFQGAVYPQGKYPCRQDQWGVALPDASGSYNYCTLQLPVGPPSFARNNRYNDASLYAMDSWKVMPRLTLNLGLRWEYYGVQHNANPNLDSNFYFGQGATIFDQIRNGYVTTAPQSPIGGLWGKNEANFAPRGGFAYDLFGDGSMSLRGGFGISYERNFGNVTYNVIQNPPNYAVTSLTSSSAISYPIYTDVAGPLAGTGTRILPATTLRAVNNHIKPAYSEFWSFAIDRQVMKGSVLSLEYVGSRGIHLYSIADINQAGCGDPQCMGYGGIYLGNSNPDARLNYQYSEINYRGSDAFSNYNGLNVRFSGNNLFNKGLMVNANYTWSHSIDNLSSTFTDGYATNYMLGFTDAFNPNLDKGQSDFDVRHRFVLSGVWNLPWGNNMSNAVARNVLGGWQVSSIFVTHSGNPYTIYDCTWAVAYSCARWTPTQPVAKNGLGSPVLVGSNLYAYLPLAQNANTGLPIGAGTVSPEPTCTGLLAVGCTYTTTGIPMGGRNAYPSPGYWNFNFVFAKTFKLTERFQLQLRGEMYNAFNHHNLYVLPTNLDVSAGLAAVQVDKGGTMPNGPGYYSDERRNVQFGLKLNF